MAPARWAARVGADLREVGPAGPVVAAVEAFAAGCTAVIVLAAPIPDAFLDLTVAELAAPLTAVVGPRGDALALVGLNEVVPALLAPRLGAAEAVQIAAGAGLSPVVLAALP